MANSRSRAPKELEPVRRIMLAVLERAVNDFQSYAAVPTGRGRRLLAEVDGWFSSSADGPLDFETICRANGLDPDFFRDGLRSLYACLVRPAVADPGTQRTPSPPRSLAIQGRPRTHEGRRPSSVLWVRGSPTKTCRFQRRGYREITG
jgi:hypothetical protein